MLAFALALPGCVRSQPGWKVTPTALANGDVAWCDSTHVAAQYSEGGSTVPAITIVDIRKPTEAVPVKISDQQDRAPDLHLVGCEAGVLVMGDAGARNPAERGFYSLAPDGTLALLAVPEVVARARGRSRPVNLRGKLIAAPMRRQAVGKTYVAEAQCARWVRPDFQVLCFDSDFERMLALQRFLVVDYLWDDPVAVVQHGELIQVTNPNPRILDRSGKSIVRATFLYGLDKSLIARLDEDELFQIAPMWLAPDPQEAWLYAPCKKKTKSRESMNDFDRVCRYRSDGVPHRWEEVFDFPLTDKSHGAIQTLGVDSQGNVVFDLPGATGRDGGIWRYDAARKKIERIVATGEHEYAAHPVLSPDGRAVLFEQNHTWKLATQ